MKHQIFFHSSENMLEVGSKTVQTIVTSPPYWDLKNYKHDKQIGYSESYERYLARMEKVWQECFRVLKDSGSIFVNINYRRFNNSIFRIQDDFLKQLISIGFIFQSKIIWNKPSGIPTALPRLADRYEYIFHLTKTEEYHLNSSVKFNDFKTLLPQANYDVWRIIKKAGSIGKKFEHPAVFPIGLAQRAIELTSQMKDYILDPFLGSGSTMIAAINSNRCSIGYEINKKFVPLINHRIENETNKNTKVDFISKRSLAKSTN